MQIYPEQLTPPTSKAKKDTTITFSVKTPAGPQQVVRDSCQRRRWKTPSQLKRDKERKDKFLTKKLEEQNKTEAAEKVLLHEPKDELVPEETKVCEKIFIFPKQEIPNHNIGIEYDVKDKLKAKGLKVKKVKVERIGNPVKGDYVRTEVLIEPADAKMVEKENFGIENCWVLPVI